MSWKPAAKVCAVGVAFLIAVRQPSAAARGIRRHATVDGGQRSGTVDLGLWGFLTILAGVMAFVFASCVFRFMRRLEHRTPAPEGEKVGAHKVVLAKLRKGESMSPEELEYAEELVSDARSPFAYAIPAVLFTIGFFYVVGCLYMLHRDGGNPSFRTFVGGIPMLSSLNIVAQLSRVARMKGRLQEVPVTAPDSTEELTTVGGTGISPGVEAIPS
jgi:hypothetical protein